MAIVKMSKFNLIFFPEKRDELLYSLQHFKYVHFTDLKEDQTSNSLNLDEIPRDKNHEMTDKILQKTAYIIRILENYKEKQDYIRALKEGVPTYSLAQLQKEAEKINIEDTYQQTKLAIDSKESLNREITNIKNKIKQLEPWVSLDFSFKHLKAFKECHVDLCIIPNRLFQRFQDEIEGTSLTYHQIVHKNHQNTFFIVITHITESQKVEETILNTGVSKLTLDYDDTPKEVIRQLKEQKQALKNKLKSEIKKLKHLASLHLDEIKLMYDYLLQKKLRLSSTGYFLKTRSINIIEGYIPTKLHKQFEELLKKNLGKDYLLKLEEANIDDSEVPILLENSEFFQAFESVTEMYALPKYNEIDPTPWFSIFYAIFFGMMIGDAGYGLLMFILTFIILRAFTLTKRQRNFFNFFYYLSFSTLFWGAIFGSFFGNVFELPALIDTTEEYNFLLILSIVLGIIHVFFALGVQAYVEIKRGKPLNALFDVGFWYLLLIGAFVLLLSLFVTSFKPYQTIGLVVMILGMLGIFLTGGRKQKSIGGKIAGGLYSLYGITNYIGDFVSYSRLMALALASGFIAYAINLMVGMLFNLGFLGVITGLIVFVIGQGFNLFLSILSSYVHTLRLTYVEFFGKFYEGGGRPFQIFRNASKYINVN